jgi:SAM-dependent methyltransferase
MLDEQTLNQSNSTSLSAAGGRGPGALSCGTVSAMAGALFDAGTVPEVYERYLVPPIFKPWAAALADFADVTAGEVVLDVASGTGVVAALAADRVGDAGRVVATDLSGAMLALAAASHPMIETMETAADELAVGDSSFDVALCQQGFQFLTDRPAAAQAMNRTLCSPGRIAVAVWMSGTLLEPFDVYGHVLERQGVPEPFPRAYAYDFSMSPEEVADVLTAAGFTNVEIETRVMEVSWLTLDDAVQGIAGTPYGPAVAALDEEDQLRISAALQDELHLVHPMTAVLARGRKL